MLTLDLSTSAIAIEPDTSIEDSSSKESIDVYQSAGYKLVNHTLTISRNSNKTQPDCPICTYQFKPYCINAENKQKMVKVKPNTKPCPICGFNFIEFYQSGFNIGAYFKKTHETIPKFPKLLQVQVKKFNDTELYKEIHKKWPNEKLIKSQISKALENKWCGDHICDRENCKRCISNQKNDCRKLLSIIQIAQHHTKLLKQQQVMYKYIFSTTQHNRFSVCHYADFRKQLFDTG